MAGTNDVWKQHAQSKLRFLLRFINVDRQCYTCRLNIRDVTSALCCGTHEYLENCKKGGRMHRNARGITVVIIVL